MADALAACASGIADFASFTSQYRFDFTRIASDFQSIAEAGSVTITAVNTKATARVPLNSNFTRRL
jgi:hypothetical protein